MSQWTWTPDRIEQLKTLWAEGYSASAVARTLGDGVSRNAVLSKIHRMGFAARSPDLLRPIQRQHHPRPRQSRSNGDGAEMHAPLQDKQPSSPAPEPIGPVAESAERGCCQYIHGDVGSATWRMCGHPGFPWCDYHRPRMFNGRLPIPWVAA